MEFLRNDKGEKLYMRFDIQDVPSGATEETFKRDDIEHDIETFSEMRDWLADFWQQNPDEDMSNRAHNKLIRRIENSPTEIDLIGRMEGIEYFFLPLGTDKEPIFGIEYSHEPYIPVAQDHVI